VLYYNIDALIYTSFLSPASKKSFIAPAFFLFQSLCTQIAGDNRPLKFSRQAFRGDKQKNGWQPNSEIELPTISPLPAHANKKTHSVQMYGMS